MTKYVYDIETNAVDFNDLPNTLKVIHCLAMVDLDTDEAFLFNDSKPGMMIAEGLEKLRKAELVVGQNIKGFDIPAIQVLYPDWRHEGKVRDTKIMSKTIYPHLRDLDFSYTRRKIPTFPLHLIGAHSLEAWGARMKEPKDDFSKRMRALGLDPWGELPEEYARERERYCVQDVRVNVKLYKLLTSRGFTDDAIDLEHDVWDILTRIRKRGVVFDTAAAIKLQSTLVSRKQTLVHELQSLIGPFYVRDGKTLVPKRDNKTRGYTAGAPLCKVKLVEFNPGSRQHIGNRLINLYGWKPKEFGKDGVPTCDEPILAALPYPPVELLLEYLMVDKRLGQLAEGNEAWLRHEKNGLIHGFIDHMGTVTSRMSHSKPNLGQVPASSAPYGHECRSLFKPRLGYVLVGCDADALELRCLAGEMAPWDGGAYIQTVLNGRKEDGTDMHTRNMQAIGLKKRDTAKTWFYAYIYGAGDYKLGCIIASEMDSPPTAQTTLSRMGKTSRENFQKNLPALGKLVEKVKSEAKSKGKIRGLDGRYHPARAEHSALNTRLQGAGAIFMKRALVIADRWMQDEGFIPGVEYEFVLNVHDEFQTEVLPEYAELVGCIQRAAIREAGRYYKFGCPLDGEYKIGASWAETH